jgi:hypothetical protein
MVLLNVNDPAAAAHVYTYTDPLDGRDYATWGNLYWTGGGTYNDVLLVSTEDTLLMVGVDSNYGTITCVAIQ